MFHSKNGRGILTCAVVALLLLTALQSCRETEKQAMETEEVGFTPEGELRLVRMPADSLLVRLEVEIAETDYETQTGLMYRTEMRDDRGMLFIFQDEALHSFYMKNTQIPLDILFIGSDSTIRTIRRNARPMDQSSIPSGVPVQFVLEINAGLSDRWGLQPGDRMEITRLEN